MLLTHVTGLSRTEQYAHPETLLNDAQQQSLDACLARRSRGEPLAYITGIREFWSLPLSIGPGALVPRPDTELLVEQTLNLLPRLPAGCIIELGTGSGAIALALAQEIDDRLIVAFEKYDQAIAIARRNIEQLGKGRVSLVQANWLDATRNDCAALVIANPPYLATNDPHLPTLGYEPRTALVSGNTGLEDIEQLIHATQSVGRPGSALLLEHGATQGAAVRSLLAHYTYTQIDTARDLAGHERISVGFIADCVS